MLIAFVSQNTYMYMSSKFQELKVTFIQIIQNSPHKMPWCPTCLSSDLAGGWLELNHKIIYQTLSGNIIQFKPWTSHTIVVLICKPWSLKNECEMDTLNKNNFTDPLVPTRIYLENPYLVFLIFIKTILKTILKDHLCTKTWSDLVIWYKAFYQYLVD